MAHVPEERSSELVTVVICAYNAGDFLRPSVESILNQTYTKLEVLIIDDGSTDGCMSTIQDLGDPRIRILHQENQGKSVALNYALSELSGEFYAVQDADDLSFPRRIEKQLQCMREHPETGAVFCGHDLIVNGRHVAPTCAPKDSARCRQDIEALHMPAHDPTAMYRVSMVRDLRYDAELRIGQGYDYILRIGEQFPMRVLGECLYSYRIEFEAITRRDPILRQQMHRALAAKAFERRGLGYDEWRLPKISNPQRMKNKELDNDIVSHFMTSTVDLRHAGNWGAAVHAAVSCLALHPLDPYYYKPAVYTLAPLRLIDWYRARKSARRDARRRRSRKRVPFARQ